MRLFRLRSGYDFRCYALNLLESSFLNIFFVNTGLVAVLSERRRQFFFEKAIVLLFELFVDAILYVFIRHRFGSIDIIGISSIVCGFVLMMVWICEYFYRIKFSNWVKDFPTVKVFESIQPFFSFCCELPFAILEKRLGVLGLWDLSIEFLIRLSLFGWGYGAEAGSVFLCVLNWWLWFFLWTVGEFFLDSFFRVVGGLVFEFIGLFDLSEEHFSFELILIL